MSTVYASAPEGAGGRVLDTAAQHHGEHTPGDDAEPHLRQRPREHRCHDAPPARTEGA